MPTKKGEENSCFRFNLRNLITLFFGGGGVEGAQLCKVSNKLYDPLLEKKNLINKVLIFHCVCLGFECVRVCVCSCVCRGCFF